MVEKKCRSLFLFFLWRCRIRKSHSKLGGVSRPRHAVCSLDSLVAQGENPLLLCNSSKPFRRPPLFSPSPLFFYFFPFFFPSDVEGCIAAAGQSREGGHVPGGRARFLATGQRKRGVCACVPHACPISRYPRALSVVSSSKLHALAPFALSCCCMTVELYI